MAFLLSAGGSGTDSERVHVAGKVRKTSVSLGGSVWKERSEI